MDRGTWRVIAHEVEKSWTQLSTPRAELYPSVSSVQFSCSVVSDSATPGIVACQASLSITNSRSLLKFMPITNLMNMGLGGLRELVLDREAWCMQLTWGLKESDMTEQLN